MMKLANKVKLPMLLSVSLFSLSATAAVIGNVDSITKNANETLTVSGWACDESKSRSIYVNFYVNAAPPSKSALKLISLRANNASDATISSKCGTKAISHRFSLLISKATATKYANKPLYVYGVSSSNSSTLVAITGSGKAIVATPAVTTPVVVTQPVTSTPTTPVTTTAGKILGNIDSVKERASDGAVVVSGWACDKSQKQSIKVHLYANAAAGGTNSKMIIEAVANVSSEAAVSTICGTTGIGHRFEAVIPNATAQTFSKSLVFVHGISVSNGANLTIANSGKYPINVTVPVKKIIGNIDAVTERASDRAVIVSGWACDQSVNNPIAVHLYLNGAAGTGKFIQLMTTNKASEAAVSASCGTKTAAHRFEFVIPRATALLNSNAPVYVHGISVSKGANLTIGNSGSLRMPNVSQNLYLSDLMKDASGKLITGDLTIPEGSQVKIDTSIDIKSLIINGRLMCPDTGDFTLKVSAIHVMGKEALLQCGTSVTPFKGKLKIAVKPGTVLSNCDGLLNPCSDRNIMAMNGGTIRLIGNQTNSKWLKLDKTAMPKDTEITLSENVSWVAGDLVSLAPTGFKYTEAEELIVKSVSGNRVTFTTPIKFRHNGINSSYQMPNKTWTIDERAEVANLTRNIQITSDGVPAAMDYKGAHMMVMAGSYAYIDGAEFSYMGRMGDMARYPFHWHRVGDADGQYIKNSSIHHSFQRCVTVHATHNTVVENNVCYDHFGHGFFLEDGNETGNTISGNLGVLSRRPLANRHILQSDIDVSNPERFPGPATFWVSNPNNTFTGNVSAGSQGTGFWMSFLTRISCPNNKCSRTGNTDIVSPFQTNTLKFDNNTARTNMVGFTWDGAEDGELANNPRNPNDRMLKVVHYTPKKTPKINGMQAYKSLRAAMYTRAQTMIFNNAIFADNRVNFFAAYNTIMTNTAIVAVSDNHLPEEYDTVSEFTGARIYDGPMDLRDVDFINFDDKTYKGKTITPYAFRSVGASERFGNVAQRIRFLPQPQRVILFDQKQPDDIVGNTEAANLTDLDGSITGSANTVIVPNHAFTNHSSCIAPTDKSSTALFCHYRTGQLYVFGGTYEADPFQASRSDGIQITNSAPFNRLPLIYGGGYEYSILLDGNITYNKIRLIVKTANLGDVTPVIAIRNLPTEKCKPTSTLSAKQVTSLSALRAMNESAYFTDKKVMYVKVKATSSEIYVTDTSFAEVGYGVFGGLTCY